MFKCKVCGKEFEKKISFERHEGTSYGNEMKYKGTHIHLPLLVYYCQFDGKKEFSKESLEDMYQNGMSTLMITERLDVQKITLLNTMRYYGIKFRNPSEQTKNRIKRDGLWNKGKTKFDHPSIMKYSKSRMGKNNPYFTAPNFDRRYKISCDNVKFLLDASPSRNPKTTEVRIKKILDANKISYKRNFCLKMADGCWRLYNFYINGKLLLEVNGDYWHANPKFYGAEDWISVRKSSRGGSFAKDLWEYDEEKRQLAISFGYKTYTLWEYDMKSMSDCEIVDIIKGVL